MSLQSFHVLYHTDENILLGAPTGSGKTISAELAMLRLFNTQPDMKVWYTYLNLFNLSLLLFALNSQTFNSVGVSENLDLMEHGILAPV